jgi:DNA-binding IclR family transcriptional regulator
MPATSANENVHLSDVSADATGSRTLRRGLALLEAVLAGGHDGVRVVELCQASGLGRPTVYRLLETLIDCGYVVRRDRFRYMAGARAAGLAKPAGRPNLAVQLQPVLARVSAASGDAAFAIQREGSLSHCIARQVGTHPVQVLVIQVGTQQPLGVGAAGLALLAALPDAEVAAIVATNEPVLANYGGMTAARLLALVHATRERGWSVIGNHATSGVLAVGMAVRDAEQRPIAAISVASTMVRMNRDRQRQIALWIRGALAPPPTARRGSPVRRSGS